MYVTVYLYTIGIPSPAPGRDQPDSRLSSIYSVRNSVRLYSVGIPSFLPVVNGIRNPPSRAKRGQPNAQNRTREPTSNVLRPDEPSTGPRQARPERVNQLQFAHCRKIPESNRRNDERDIYEIYFAKCSIRVRIDAQGGEGGNKPVTYSVALMALRTPRTFSHFQFYELPRTTEDGAWYTAFVF